MASGKSSVAARLEGSTRRPRVSIDQLVEQDAGQSVAELFAAEGQAEFRRREVAVLQQLDPLRNLLVDTGGGVIETPAATALLRANGVVIWLDCAWEGVRARLKDSRQEDRPLIQQLGWAGLEELFRRRRPLYASMADFRLNAGGDLEVLARTAMLRSLVWQRQVDRMTQERKTS